MDISNGPGKKDATGGRGNIIRVRRRKSDIIKESDPFITPSLSWAVKLQIDTRLSGSAALPPQRRRLATFHSRRTKSLGRAQGQLLHNSHSRVM